MKKHIKPATMLVAGAGALCLTLSGCAGAGSLGASDQTITIAMVSNSQMQDAQKLASQFEEENPDIDLKFVTLSENQARAKITASTATGGGEFDVVMISNYETPQWAKYGWLKNLSEYAEATGVTTRPTSSPPCASRCPTRGTCTRCRSTASPRS